MGPDDELLGVVVHSGLVLGQRKDVVAALRRITAFPQGLVLDTVVLAREIHAQLDRKAPTPSPDASGKGCSWCAIASARPARRTAWPSSRPD